MVWRLAGSWRQQQPASPSQQHGRDSTQANSRHKDSGRGSPTPPIRASRLTLGTEMSRTHQSLFLVIRPDTITPAGCAPGQAVPAYQQPGLTCLGCFWTTDGLEWTSRGKGAQGMWPLNTTPPALPAVPAWYLWQSPHFLHKLRQSCRIYLLLYFFLLVSCMTYPLPEPHLQHNMPFAAQVHILRTGCLHTGSWKQLPAGRAGGKPSARGSSTSKVTPIPASALGSTKNKTTAYLNTLIST